MSQLTEIKTKSSDPKVCQAKELANESVKKMYEFLQNNELIDVILISGNDNQRYPAHRLVLSSASNYFHTMFTCNLRETTQTEIILNEIDGDILGQIVKFCYTGFLDVNEKNVQALFAASNLLQLDFISQSCCAFFIEQLDPSNCLGFLMFAEKHSCSELIHKSQSFINEHFMNVIKNQEFLDLDVDNVIQLLKNENLNVTCEDIVFEAVRKWILFDANRSQYTPTLLQYVKLPLVTPSFLFETIEPFSSPFYDCLKLIIEAARWHLVPAKRSSLISFRTKPRKSTLSNLMVIGGIDEKRNVSMTGNICSEIYCPRMDKWYVVYDILTRKSQFSSVIVDDKIYVVGGRLALRAMNTVDCIYNPNCRYEEIRTPMKISRLGLGVGILNGSVYAVGGYDGWNYLNGVEKFDLTTQNWNYATPMSHSRGALSVAVLDDKLYAIGGRDNSTSFRSVEVYNPRTQKWSFAAEMNKSRANAGVAVLNGFIYIVGGLTLNMPLIQRLDSVERYDQHTNTWTMVANISSKRDSVSVGVMGDSLIAVGGYDGEKELTIVEKYDFVQDKWSPMAPLNIPRAGASVLNGAELKLTPAIKCNICQEQ